MKRLVHPLGIVLLLGLAFIRISHPAFGLEHQEPDTKISAALGYLDAMGLQEIFARSVENIMPRALEPVRHLNPKVDDQTWQKFMSEVAEESKKEHPALMRLLAGILAKYTSVEDLNVLSDFYRTTLGRKFARVIPDLLVAGWQPHDYSSFEDLALKNETGARGKDDPKIAAKAAVLVKNFSLEELKALSKFWESPAAQHLSENAAQVRSEYTDAAQKRVNNVSLPAVHRIQERYGIISVKPTP